MQGHLIQTGSTSNTKFEPSPLDPTWVTEGTPAPRGLTLTKSSDDMLSCGLWDCGVGKFKFHYFCDEIVHILEGEVIVQEPGAEYTLRAGDVAYFPEGLTTHWTVPNYVRKFCIHRCTKRTLLGRIVGKLRKVFGKVGL